MGTSLPDIEELEKGIVGGDRVLLARAITLIESQKKSDAKKSEQLLSTLLAKTGCAHRVGITGVPGVGKSTLIEAMCLKLLDRGLRIAVLAVDPSSRISGGSILGDKSRMSQLARDDRAFIRPSPNSLNLGGVARRTRESILLCEAAGFDLIIVETVGVGQAELLVADMVDTFVLMALPGAGDELQAFKKGVLEYADVIAVNKADGDNLERAQMAKDDLDAAGKYLHPKFDCWTTKTLLTSAKNGNGLNDLWQVIAEHKDTLHRTNLLKPHRAEQLVRWMWSMIDERLQENFRSNADVMKLLNEVSADVSGGILLPTVAAKRLLEIAK